MSDEKNCLVCGREKNQKDIEEYFLSLKKEKNKLQKEFILMLPVSHLRQFKKYRKARKRLESFVAFMALSSHPQ